MPDATRARVEWVTEYLFADPSHPSDWEEGAHTVFVRLWDSETNDGLDSVANVILETDGPLAEFSAKDFSGFVDRLVQFRDEHVTPLIG